jgi:hypothetical protein
MEPLQIEGTLQIILSVPANTKRQHNYTIKHAYRMQQSHTMNCLLTYICK